LYKLPDDYPMVASAYSAERSAMAKRIGLGRKPGKLAPPAPPRRKLKIAGPRVE
jgi:predicted transcriptional regulator